MVRRLRDARLETRSARAQIKGSALLYKSVGPGLAVGYRKGRRGGKWVARLYTGARSYRVEVLGAADDAVEADGIAVLDFWQAVAKAQALASTRVQPDGAPVGPYKVRDAVRDYLEHLEGRASHRDTSLRLSAYALPRFGDKDVAKLDRQEIARWHKDMATLPPRARTKRGGKQRHRPVDANDPEQPRRRKLSANKVLGQLKAALNFAYKDGKVLSDRAWRLVSPFKGVAAARATYLTTDDARRLINASDGDFRLLVRAALYTGCRYGELAALNVGDFNPDAGTLHVRTSKSGEPRHVVLGDEGVRFFEEVTAGRAARETMLRNGTRGEQRREGDDDGRWRPSEQLRPMRAACKRAGIDPPLGIHQLRHTWASLSVMGGMPLQVVARNLGHADTRMVERYYGHLADTFISDAIRRHAPVYGLDAPAKVAPLRSPRR